MANILEDITTTAAILTYQTLILYYLIQIDYIIMRFVIDKIFNQMETAIYFAFTGISQK